MIKRKTRKPFVINKTFIFVINNKYINSLIYVLHLKTEVLHTNKYKQHYSHICLSLQENFTLIPETKIALNIFQLKI